MLLVALCCICLLVACVYSPTSIVPSKVIHNFLSGSGDEIRMHVREFLGGVEDAFGTCSGGFGAVLGGLEGVVGHLWRETVSSRNL